MSDIERAPDGTLKVHWQYVEPSEEKTYLVPESHADALNTEFDLIRDRLEAAETAIKQATAALANALANDDPITGINDAHEILQDALGHAYGC